jgi:4-carboxymuconolactone decarboxylase
MVMSVLGMDPGKFPPPVKALYNRLAAKRRAKGEAFGGPYLALLNHPALAERVEALGFYLKFEGVLPRVVYQFIVLSVAQATGAALRVARSCPARAGRRIASVPHRRHRRAHE